MQQVLEEVRITEYDFSQGLITDQYLEDKEIIDEIIGG